MIGNIKDPYEYEPNCSRERVEELYDFLSPLEEMPEGVTRQMFADYQMLNAHGRIAVLIDGQLAGICFVEDFENYREMAFTKTSYLTNDRKITFARTIPLLFERLNHFEEMRLGKNMLKKLPMFMHTPEGDERSEKWFLRAGCVKCDKGLRCPERRSE